MNKLERHCVRGLTPHHQADAFDTFSYASPVGELILQHTSNALLSLAFNRSDQPIAANQPPLTAFGKVLAKHLDDYFNGSKLALPTLFFSGTPFQLKVWQVLKSIPYGKTMTYGAIATLLKTSPRAVGQACKANPIAIFIPCHRVVAHNQLGGFMGESIGRLTEIKQWLLKHERQTTWN